MILFFRGKAATGKTMMAKKIRNDFSYDIISKDLVFDQLLIEGHTWENANSIAYNKLADKIQGYHDKNLSLIVDIGLAHTPYYNEFLSKMTLEKKKVRSFLFICSDLNEWKKRIHERIKCPKYPNQIFKSVDEAVLHYERYSITPLDSEVVIDSSKEITEIVEIISRSIKYSK